MDGFEQERRGLFDGLTVPHSLNAIIIAAIGLVLYWVGVVGIESLMSIPGDGHCRSIAGMLGNITVRLGTFGALLAHVGGWANVITDYNGGVWLAFWGWTIVNWSLFSGAINRIAALKIAREESLEIKDALVFGAQKFLPNLLSIVFVFVLVGIFYLLFNGTIAGLVGRIPYVGGFVIGLLFVLVLVSTFLAVLLAALGVLGFNLSSSAIATEASDTFDGVSRAWNYVMARPWTMILTTFATVAYLSLVLFFGSWFLKVSVKSLAIGGWGMGATPRAVEVDEKLAEKLELPKVHKVMLPGKGDFIYQRVIYKTYRDDKKGKIFYRQGFDYALEEFRGHVGRYPASLKDLVIKPVDLKPEAGHKGWSGPYMARLPQDPWGQSFAYEVTDAKKRDGYTLTSKGKDGVAGNADDLQLTEIEEAIGPLGPPIDIAPFVEADVSFAAGGVRVWVGIARILLYAYILAYFLSAQTMVYFLLRKDVEGDDYREITLEDEFEDEGAWEHTTPPKQDPPKPAEPKAEEPKPEVEETPAEGDGDSEGEDKPEA